MSERNNPFAEIKRELPVFEPRPKRERPAANDAIDGIADETGFHSRPAVRTSRAPKRKQRMHRTGRNVGMNIKVTQQTQDRFYRLAEERKLVLGALLESALDALEKAASAAT
jgi:hypothetical protein